MLHLLPPYWQYAIYWRVFVLDAWFCVENMEEILSVCEDTDTRFMLWTMRRSYVIKKLDFETETEEYMVPVSEQ